MASASSDVPHDAAQVVPHRRFGCTDLMVPLLSFGSSGLGLLAQGSSEEEVGIAAVRQALLRGVDYVDTAPWYGRSEVVLGKALGGLPRDTFRLATKVGRYPGDYPRMFDFSAKRTLHSVQDSLARTGVSYFDVIQVRKSMARGMSRILTRGARTSVVDIAESSKKIARRPRESKLGPLSAKRRRYY
ncbi:hypothetical protein HPB47_013706 [Ixodes persulcatus]|uniref:Uncharacterized protein n=1 Tax=Ixodes persulcatus TaxID=34615 RepID=A0AC60QXV2_IXOPE|nr:hypothetical protein HPB47_013706 [Ixodes persulcatus]